MARYRCTVTMLVFLSSAAGVATAQQVQPMPVEDALIQSTKSPYAFFEPGPVRETILYADGSTLEVPTETVWRPMCGSSLEGVTPEQFREVVEAQRRALQNAPVDQGQQDAHRGSGLNIIFTNLSGFSAEALTSLAEIEAFIESQFIDNITISIDISFANMGSCGVIGSIGSAYVNTTWPTARDGLINGMDANDTIQTDIPSGSTIPVRYNGNSSTVTNENRVFVTSANFLATIGAVGGTSASITLNTSCSFDFDPSDGVSGLDFQSVVVHEVGHAMGFTSGADFRTNDIEMLDVYRFQRTDGTGDFNPDTLAEFGTTARLVDLNTPNNDHNSDLISIEYRMSDGSPFQASHLRDQNPPLGVMDPTLSFGQTFWPNFYRTPDSDLFDAIGWDFGPAGELCGDLDGDADVDGNDFGIFLSAYGRCAGEPEYVALADLDGDGCVTLVDYQRWLQCFRVFVGNPLASHPMPSDVGDMNGDGLVNGADIQGFVGVLIQTGGAGFREIIVADVNGDGAVDATDVGQFVTMLVGQP